MKKLKLTLKEKLVKLRDTCNNKIRSIFNLNKLIEKTSMIIKKFITIIIVWDFKGADDNLKVIDKNNPLFVIVRLLYFYIFAGISIASFSILIGIIKNVHISLIKNFFSLIFFFTLLFFTFGIGAVRIFFKTGEQQKDTKEISDLLNKSMIPIITFIVIMSLTPLENSDTPEFLKNKFFLEIKEVFLKVMPLVITIIYNLKVFWFKMNEINKNNKKDETTISQNSTMIKDQNNEILEKELTEQIDKNLSEFIDQKQAENENFNITATKFNKDNIEENHKMIQKKERIR